MSQPIDAARCPGRGGCGVATTVAARPGRAPGGAVAPRPAPPRPRRRRTARWRPGWPIEGSSRCTVSEHSSTDSSTATWSGLADAGSRAAGRCPAAPATQPSPNSGTRLTSGRSPSRGDQPGVQAGRRDAGDGRGHDEVDVLAVSPPGQAPCTARSPSASAASMNASLASVKPDRRGSAPAAGPGAADVRRLRSGTAPAAPAPEVRRSRTGPGPP